MGNERGLRGKGRLWLDGYKSAKAIQAGHREAKACMWEGSRSVSTHGNTREGLVL